MAEIVSFPKQTEIDLQKTCENVANNDVQHAIIITLHGDNSFKVHSTADDDLTAELLWDSLTMYEGRANKPESDDLAVEAQAEELKLCDHCGHAID